MHHFHPPPEVIERDVRTLRESYGALTRQTRLSCITLRSLLSLSLPALPSLSSLCRCLFSFALSLSLCLFRVCSLLVDLQQLVGRRYYTELLVYKYVSTHKSFLLTAACRFKTLTKWSKKKPYQRVIYMLVLPFTLLFSATVPYVVNKVRPTIHVPCMRCCPFLRSPALYRRRSTGGGGRPVCTRFCRL